MLCLFQSLPGLTGEHSDVDNMLPLMFNNCITGRPVASVSLDVVKKSERLAKQRFLSQEMNALILGYLIDVRDEFALFRHVDFLIVCSHLALDSKEKNFQISFLCKSVGTQYLV